MIAGFMAGAGGIILASRIRSVSTGTGGGNLLLNVIAAAVIGGTSLFGGQGRWVARCSALVMARVANGMDSWAWPSGTKFIVTGLVLLAAVLVDSLSKKGRASAGLVWALFVAGAPVDGPKGGHNGGRDGGLDGLSGAGTVPDTVPMIETRAEEASPDPVTLVDVAEEQGVEFTHGAFRWDVSGDRAAMMGGGCAGSTPTETADSTCTRSTRTPRWSLDGGKPRARCPPTASIATTAAASPTSAPVRGPTWPFGRRLCGRRLRSGRSDRPLRHHGRGNFLLWGGGDGTFTEGAEAAGVDAYGWYTGAAVGDVNGDGWPDLFVSGYVNVNRADRRVGAGSPNSHRASTTCSTSARARAPTDGSPSGRWASSSVSIPMPTTASEPCSPMSIATTTSTSTWPTTPTRAASTSMSR